MSRRMEWHEGAGREIEVEVLASVGPPKAKKHTKPFQARWVKFPASWLTALRTTRSASTMQLALEILFAEFRRRHTGGAVVLSSATSTLPRGTRVRAARELAALGLVEIELSGKQAVRVVKVCAG